MESESERNFWLVMGFVVIPVFFFLLFGLLLRADANRRERILKEGRRARGTLVKAESNGGRAPTTTLTLQMRDTQTGESWVLNERRRLMPEHIHLIVPGTEFEVLYDPFSKYSNVVILGIDHKPGA
ncbi:hypothetical protein F0U61_49950 [Archangium violaceum]|uniref:hypothetical protein n=1 Tax=Archangium violaceum TaxID=83451 RepID=UPI002B2D7A72|nr:hypothetical protein F0U61_49950 [Archangium violaceum]